MYIFVFLQFPLSPKYIFQFEQIYFAIWSNTFSNLNKYFCNSNKYSSLPFMDNGYISVFPQFPLSAKHFQNFPKQLSFAHCLSQSITIGKTYTHFQFDSFHIWIIFQWLEQKVNFLSELPQGIWRRSLPQEIEMFLGNQLFLLKPISKPEHQPFLHIFVEK